jgi:hypothetical protein
MGQRRKSAEIEADGYPVKIDQPFFNLWQAWAVKGGVCPWEGFRRYPYIQPKGGHYDGYIGGKGVFTNETIREWMYLTDEDMGEYHRKYQTGAKPRSEIKKGAKLEATGFNVRLTEKPRKNDT